MKGRRRDDVLPKIVSNSWCYDRKWPITYGRHISHMIHLLHDAFNILLCQGKALSWQPEPCNIIWHGISPTVTWNIGCCYHGESAIVDNYRNYSATFDAMKCIQMTSHPDDSIDVQLRDTLFNESNSNSLKLTRRQRPSSMCVRRARCSSLNILLPHFLRSPNIGLLYFLWCLVCN